MAKVLLAVAFSLAAFGALARWQSETLVSRSARLVDRSLDASLEYAASLDRDHSEAEVTLLDGRRTLLLCAARWHAAGRLTWAVAFVALLGAFLAREVGLSLRPARAPG